MTTLENFVSSITASRRLLLASAIGIAKSQTDGNDEQRIGLRMLSGSMADFRVENAQ
jgi:hypothetical protein